MAAPFDDRRDWVELCTFFGGEHREYELGPVQFALVDRLLRLTCGEPATDDEIAQTLLPALLQALREA